MTEKTREQLQDKGVLLTVRWLLAAAGGIAATRSELETAAKIAVELLALQIRKHPEENGMFALYEYALEEIKELDR